MSSRTGRKIASAAKTSRLHRREFLQAAGLGAAGFVATASAASPKSNAATLDTDVLICGGGCAGIGAALAAARQGARTLLIERAGFAGGIITSVGLPYFDGIADIKDNRIVTRGIALELLAKSGVCKPDATHVNVHNPTIPNVESFKVLLDELVTAEHERLKVLFHTFAADARVQNNRITEVTVANKAGLVRIRPKVVIDCTGDADIAQWAGAPTEKNAELQPMTLHFRIGNVKRTPDTSKLCRAALEKAHARGELPMFYGPGIMFLFAPDEVYVHGIRVPGDATDPDQFTRAEMQGRRDAWTMFEAWHREVQGFENAYFMTSGPFIGVRETRRIVGQHVLTEQEITANKKFDDAVATGCWYLDQHPNKVTLGSANATPKVQPAPYDIPYRSLVAQKVSNLLVAGRCHSATQLAASSTRVTVTAMAMGEAAGVAAAMSLSVKKLPAEISGVEVRKKLRSLGTGPNEHGA